MDFLLNKRICKAAAGSSETEYQRLEDFPHPDKSGILLMMAEVELE